MSKTEKLVVVLTNFLSITEASMEDILQPLIKILCIHHLFRFQKNIYKTSILIDLSSEVNAMTPVCTAKLGFKV